MGPSICFCTESLSSPPGPCLKTDLVNCKTSLHEPLGNLWSCGQFYKSTYWTTRHLVVYINFPAPKPPQSQSMGSCLGTVGGKTSGDNMFFVRFPRKMKKIM